VLTTEFQLNRAKYAGELYRWETGRIVRDQTGCGSPNLDPRISLQLAPREPPNKKSTRGGIL